MTEKLKGMRTRIDELDRELLRVVADRMSLVRQIGAEKGNDHPVLDPARESEVRGQWSNNAADEGVAAILTTRLLREVLSHSRRLQEIDRHAAPAYLDWVERVGYQGEAGAYSEQATRNRVPGHRVQRIGYRSFHDTASALARGEIDCAMLPVENTIVGSIEEVASLLYSGAMTILDEELLRIRHCLAVLPGTRFEEVRRVTSHPVALQQCRKRLEGLGLEPVICYDTAAAAAIIAAGEDRSLAALCSVSAAEAHGLVILERDIEDQPNNFTRFLLLARSDDPRAVREAGRPLVAKTSLVMTLSHRPGSLARCLQILASKGINLTRIDSRPQPPWDYLFAVDFDGHKDEMRVTAALNELRNETEELRLLGSYPNRTSPTSAIETDHHTPGPSTVVMARSEKADGRLVTATERGRTIVQVGDVAIGGDRFVLIAGPCAVENEQQIRDAAAMVAQAGARILRGGAFKPRTSPYSFQGLGLDGADLLSAAGKEHGLPVVTEVLDVRHLIAVAQRATMLQVGARNMQNFELLKELGRMQTPVLLKRGMSATIEELLDAAEYILSGGNHQVVLCERGIRTFERSTRNTLDIAAVPLLKSRTHLPVVVDPSHAAGRRDLVIPLALAAVAAGADGLIVEAHPRPDEALSDREQSLGSEDLGSLVRQVKAILLAQGRRF